jgi:glycosyltransferase involved in cell wall biosynthesis
MGQSAEGQAWKPQMKELLGQDGVTEYGLVGSERIARAYKAADIWAYPTGFSEIDCITATKAMAAGAVPITTDIAVFPERNQGVRINGNIEKKGTRELFLEALITLFKDENEKSKIRAKMNVSDYDWDIVAKCWADKMFES